MAAEEDKRVPTWGLAALSWLLSFYFGLGFLVSVGFPPNKQLAAGDAAFGGLWLLFLFLPFYSKIKLSGVIELERDVAKAKEELREFKAEVRNSMSVLSTNVNTLGDMTNNVTVNIPALAELQLARQEVAEKAPPDAKNNTEEIRQELVEHDNDPSLALARTRIEIERLLRVILGKSTTAVPSNEGTIRYMTIGRMFDQFVSERDQYYYLKQSFRYVLQVCNAAIHAQRVPDNQAQEALALGAQIIAVLKLAAAN